MEKKLFRYYLEHDGIVVEIPHAPIGYENTSVTFRRDMKYWGVLRSFSLPLKFVLSGGEYLKKIFLNRGVDVIVFLRVDRLVDSTQQYETIYRGELDFSQAVQDHTGIELPVMDGDLQAKIKAYERTQFEYDLSQGGVDATLVGTDFSDLVSATVSGQTSWIISKIAGINVITSEIPTGVFSAQSQFEEEFVNSSGDRVVDFSTSSNFFLTAAADTVVTLRGTLDVNFKNFGSAIKQFYNVDLYSSDSANGTRVERLATTRDYSSDGGHSAVFNIDKEITLEAGKRYFIVIATNLVSNVNVNFSINSGNLSVTRTGTSDSAVIKAFRPKDLCEKLLNSIRPLTQLTSNLLDDVDVLITSGDAIRGIPDAKLKTSFEDFYKSMDALYCIGMSTHGNAAVIENREFFFRNTYKVVDLDRVKDLTIEPFTDIMFSNIKAGYGNYTYDDERGRQEFNQGQNWKTPSYRVQTDLDIMSAYRADQFGIEELLKKNFSGIENQTDTDSNSDNDVFFLFVKKEPVGGSYQLVTAADFDLVTGVSDRTFTYNLDISPKRNLLRHIDFIKSAFWGDNENGYLLLTYADKNAMLTTQRGNETVSESTPIYLKDHPGRMFLPFLIRFTTDYPRNMKKLIDASPEGYFRVRYKGKYFSAYIYETTVDLAENSEQEFTFILSKDNNIENLL